MRIPRTLPKLSLNGELCANGKCVFVFASALDISFDTVLGNVKSDWNMKNIKNFQNDQRCIQLAIQICGRQLSQQSNPLSFMSASRFPQMMRRKNASDKRECYENAATGHNISHVWWPKGAAMQQQHATKVLDQTACAIGQKKYKF